MGFILVEDLRGVDAIKHTQTGVQYEYIYFFTIQKKITNNFMVATSFHSRISSSVYSQTHVLLYNFPFYTFCILSVFAKPRYIHSTLVLVPRTCRSKNSWILCYNDALFRISLLSFSYCAEGTHFYVIFFVYLYL